MSVKPTKLPGHLIIVPCGRGKVWDKTPDAGPTAAKDVYSSGYFTLNRSYAVHFGEAWVILSALYGFVSPDFQILGPYEVTFKRKSSGPVTTDILREQIQRQSLDRFHTVIGLGGREYRTAIEQAFQGKDVDLLFPFAGLPSIGRIQQATKRSIARNDPLNFD